MDRKALTARILWVVLGVVVGAGVLIGCAAGSGGPEGQDPVGSEQTNTREGTEGGGGEHGSGEGLESGGEHGSGEGDGEHGAGDGEHGSGGEGRSEEGSDGPEGSGGGSEAGEAATSSPIVPLDQQWEGVLGGLAVTARYDQATRTVHTTARNTLSHVLCYVQTEPHLKSGSRTVGELGPGVMGHLSPGEVATSVLAVAGEPSLAGVSYDGLVTHMEVFDCAGTGPVPHSAEGGEGGREGTGEGSGASGEEGSAAMLAVGETFDQVRAGARLILRYDPPSNSFRGTVENTTNGVLTRVRIEVHLSNGTELGPTVPVDMAPGTVLAVSLAATPEPFTGWIPHAEVGSGEHGAEGEGEEGAEGAGEHGSGGEGAGEHGGG